jgi:predicted flap endonuclease-1-like 5' DNA nuclease
VAYSIKELKDLTASTAEKLVAAGIATTDDLLAKAGHPKGRKEVADAIGVAHKEVLTWVNEADLSRVPGVAGVYSRLLEASGVDTVKELATRNAENLTAKIAEVNKELNISGRIPTKDQVAGWIASAKGLAPKVFH